jgi:hypothetical protein
MKYSVREAVARSYVGWDFAQADRVIAWLDECGYVIVKKDGLQAETATTHSARKNENLHQDLPQK